MKTNRLDLPLSSLAPRRRRRPPALPPARPASLIAPHENQPVGPSALILSPSPPPTPPDLVASPHGHPDRHPTQLMRPLRPTPLVLSAQEKAELELLSRRQAAPQRAVQRARIILLAAQNMTLPAIAAMLQVCANTARKWIGRYTRQPLGTPTTENPAPQPS